MNKVGKEYCACGEGLYLVVVGLVLVRGVAHSHSSVGTLVLAGVDRLLGSGLVDSVSGCPSGCLLRVSLLVDCLSALFGLLSSLLLSFSQGFAGGLSWQRQQGVLG